MKKSFYIYIGLAVIIGLAFFVFSSNDSQQSEQREIQLYYYNQKADPEIMCLEEAVQPVIRKVAVPDYTVEGAISLLLKGELTAEEKAAGFATEFPGNGFELKNASLNGSRLVLEFSDPYNFSSGGSCRVGLLRAQVEKTVRQFSGVTSVDIVPESLFQP